MSVTRAEVEAVLDGVALPAGGSLGAAGIVRALVVEGGAVRFVIEVDPAEAKAMEPVRALAEARVRAMPGVQSVQVAMTAHSAPKAPPSLKVGGHPTPQAGPLAVPGVARIIAVASGKGGSANRPSRRTSPWPSRARGAGRACSMPTSTGRASRA